MKVQREKNEVGSTLTRALAVRILQDVKVEGKENCLTSHEEIKKVKNTANKTFEDSAKEKASKI